MCIMSQKRKKMKKNLKLEILKPIWFFFLGNFISQGWNYEGFSLVCLGRGYNIGSFQYSFPIDISGLYCSFIYLT